MNRKKILGIVLCIAAAALLNIWIFKRVGFGRLEECAYTLNMQFEADEQDDISVYYTNSDKFIEDQMSKVYYENAGAKTDMEYLVGLVNKTLRIDFGTKIKNARIYSIVMEGEGQQIELDLASLGESEGFYLNDISSAEYRDGAFCVETEGPDPYIAFNVNVDEIKDRFADKLETRKLVLDVFLCVLIDLMVLVGIKYINRLLALPVEVIKNRGLIMNLAKNDFKTRFAGSYLGIVWAFIQPVVTVLVYWFVFEKGLRAGRMCDYPFVTWLVAGLVPWFFFSEALNGGTNALLEYNYLVKKVVFKISILPIVKVLSALFVNLFFIAFTIILCWAYGYAPSLYTLQIIYYVLCGFLLVLGLSYLTSALVGFFRDLTQLINIILQVGMWMTPIMWDAQAMLTPKLLFIIKLNPVYYIVDGFRDSLLGHVWMWEKPLWTIYFFIVVTLIFAVGATVFKKLRVHFADVL